LFLASEEPTMALIEFLTGVLLVLLVLSDIFRTILLPRPTHRALRLAPLLGETLSPAWRWGAGRIQVARARQTFRSSLGPLLMLLSIFIWAGLLVLGYALMLHARRFDMRPPPDLLDALFDAGSAFVTIGFTDLAISGPSRFVTVLAGMTGLAGVTILATFILSVQSSLQAREVLTIQLAATVKRPFTGLAILLALGRNNSHDRLPSLFLDWSRWSAGVLYSHRANPILMEFRSSEEDGEWLAALGALLDAATLVLAYFDPKQKVEEFSAAREFYLTGGHTVLELARLFGLEAATAQEQAPERDEDIRDALRNAGYPVSDALDCARKAAKFRTSYFGLLRALASEFDIWIENDLLATRADEVGPLADEKHFYKLR
jgi:hypothetical protein